jgi:signal transduction histidine kinase
VIAVAINAVQPAADAKKIRLEVMLVPCPGIISADPDRLQQVVCNLLSNSIKFTPIGGRVEIRVACSESSAQFQVIDTGIGIKPELLPYIFDRFWQAESTSNKTQTGLGLGLAIASDLVKLHGGTICAESSGEGQGATLTVTLPLMNVPR